MNWDALGAIAELVGAIGVLTTLGYLAIQIRDNTRSLEAASLQSVLDGPRDRYFLPMAQDPEMADIYARGLNGLEHLDPEERRRFFYMMYEQFFQMQQVFQLHERRLITEVDYQAWLAYTAAIIQTPGGTDLWEQAKKLITPTIREVIDAGLEAYADQPSFLEQIPLFRDVEPAAKSHS